MGAGEIEDAQTTALDLESPKDGEMKAVKFDRRVEAVGEDAGESGAEERLGVSGKPCEDKSDEADAYGHAKKEDCEFAG